MEERTRTPPRLVSAGAGSGKTHRIVEEIVRRVREGLPIERIAAVTFTDAAAAELQERLRTRLIAEGLGPEAARVEGAAVCTIHRFALDLLGRYPLAAGVSPAPLVLDEIAAASLLERVLGEDLRSLQAGSQRRWMEDCLGPGLGLWTSAYDEGETPSGRLRALVRDLLEKCRSLAMDPSAVEAEGEAAAQRLRAVLGAPGDAAALEAQLAAGNAHAMRWLDENPTPPYKADQPLHELLCALRAEPEASPLDHAVRVVRARCGTRTAHALRPLLEAARAVAEGHPEVQQRLLGAVRGSFACTARVLRRYQQEKVRLGAVDFEDMQVRAYDLLSGRFEALPPYAPLLADALPCVIVDEFQDTSPLQYRIFDALREAGAEVTYVGDLKQGIYGFRAADSALFGALLAQAGEGEVETLGRSRRSRPELVAFANAFFGALLPGAAMPFDPLVADNAYTRGACPRDEPCVDVVWHPRPDQPLVRVRAGVTRLRALLASGATVLDRATGVPRPLRLGDIAVLAPRHVQLARWNDALREAGIATALEGGSLFDALEVRLARAWLAMLASPRDRAAAATVLVSELYGISQRTMVRLALRNVAGSPRRALALADEDPVALPLEDFERRALARCEADLAWGRTVLRQRALPQAVEAVLERVELAGRLAQRRSGAEAAQMRANLAALVAYAHDLAARGDAGLGLVGATGATVENYLLTLDAAEARAPRMPGVEAGTEAVRLVTLHGAKGMEYPVVFLDALATEAELRLPRVEVVRPGDPASLLGTDALARSGVRLVPEVAIPSWRERLARSFGAEQSRRAEWLRLLYVAVTRAREHLVVLWPELGGGATTWVRTLLGDAISPPPAGSAEGTAGSWLGVPVRAFTVTEASAESARPAPTDLALWRSMVEDPRPGESVAEVPRVASTLARVAPSDLCQAADCPEVLRIARFTRGDRHNLARNDGVPVSLRPLPSLRAQRAAVPSSVAAPRVGLLVHSAVERARLLEGDAVRAALADEILAGEVLAANGQTEHARPLTDLVVGTLDSLRAALAALGCEQEPAREVPFAIDLAGSTLHGVIDLVVATPAGLHVIDLKTHLLRAEELPRWAAYYTPQLDAYALALTRITGLPVAGRHLAVPAAGALVTLPGDFDPAAAEAALGAIVEGIARGVPGPARDCARCGWLDLCRVGRTVVARRAEDAGTLS